MYSEADILELASKVRADSTHLLSARKVALKVARQFLHSRYENRGEAQENMVENLCKKIVRRLENLDRLECGRTLATKPVLISTQIWAERILLMRVETLKGRKTEDSERLWKREEEARELEEEARGQEEEARERLRKRKESQMSSYSEVIQQSLQPRNRVRAAEQLRAYIEHGQWGCVLKWKVSMCIL
jgi:hypothetical protein